MKTYEIQSSSGPTDEAIFTARMCLPPRDLSGLIFAMIERDTRELDLKNDQRFNRFPVSALCSVVWVLEGNIHLIDNQNVAPENNPVLPPLFFSGPFDKPFVSWSSGALHSVSISFYMDSWADLTGREAGAYLNRIVPLEEMVSEPLFSAFETLENCSSGAEILDRFGVSIRPHWADSRTDTSPFISDWIKSFASRSAMSGAGKSLRQMQRRVKSLTGGSARALQKSARMEALHKEIKFRQNESDFSLASLAHDLGYADQSHMGREFRAVTGLSPKKIGKLIDTDESYWCYKLLGERFL